MSTELTRKDIEDGFYGGEYGTWIDTSYERFRFVVCGEEDLGVLEAKVQRRLQVVEYLCAREQALIDEFNSETERRVREVNALMERRPWFAKIFTEFPVTVPLQRCWHKNFDVLKTEVDNWYAWHTATKPQRKTMKFPYPITPVTWGAAPVSQLELSILQDFLANFHNRDPKYWKWVEVGRDQVPFTHRVLTSSIDGPYLNLPA